MKGDAFFNTCYVAYCKYRVSVKYREISKLIYRIGSELKKPVSPIPNKRGPNEGPKRREAEKTPTHCLHVQELRDSLLGKHKVSFLRPSSVNLKEQILILDHFIGCPT